MAFKKVAFGFLIILGFRALVVGSPDVAFGGEDWPMWRFDAERSAASPNRVGEKLHLQWQRQFAGREQAWDDPLNLDLMTYDRLFEPIVVDGRLIVGFNDRDKVMAFDLETGDVLWTFYTEAPVRMPPAGSAGKIYVTSDDGFLYCIDAKSGVLAWKFDGAPRRRHAIGNRRLTSAWPARGGPVLRDGNVYFASSIWPFMGTFIYALDAKSGEVQWVNDRTGSQYIKQPHSAPSFAGVAPQGALVATQSHLVVPGGRSVPAVFERESGELRYFELNAGGKGTGGSFVSADEKHFYVHTRLKGTRAFRLDDGVKTAFMPNEPVLHEGVVYSAENEKGVELIRAYDNDGKLLWKTAADGSGDLILAGKHLIAAGESGISVLELADDQRSAKLVNSIKSSPNIERLLVADGKIVAVTTEGQIQVFGDGPPSNLNESTGSSGQEIAADDDVVAEEDAVAKELMAVGEAVGYAFWYGDSSDSRFRALAMNSPFEQLAVIDRDGTSVDSTRRFLDQRGILGSVSVHEGNANDFMPPSYVGNMVFVQDADQLEREAIERVYQSVRPYGGVMYLLTQDRESVLERVRGFELEKGNAESATHGVIVRREGALPGAADWTHQYGDVANTVKSNDSRVKLPLGVLWFGGSSNMDVLPRHGHGPPEQVVGGRLFIQGMNSLSARDVYTGRVLWKREFKDLGTYDVFYDATYENTPLNPKYNQVHIPGANARGTNYVVANDRVYIVEGSVCHALDPATGKTLADFELPATQAGEQEEWGYIGVYEDVLIGGLGFAMYRDRNRLAFDSDKKLKASKAGFGSKSYDRAASVALVGFDRYTGKQLWKVDSVTSFWHNGIVAGGGKIFCLDRTPKQIEDALLRRGKSNAARHRIVAFDYKTGAMSWEIKENIFGTWLGYSEQYDLLLQAGAKASDRLVDEVAEGMAVYRGKDGGVQWGDDALRYSGPCILYNDLIITNANSYSESAGAFYLKTGEPKLVRHPLTGAEQPWKIRRAYGCNNIIASENLLTFRSGAAGFYDLKSEGGTGNLGGFKSGCTSNLVVANGVLNAPDYTRTCSCAYQNQTSLGLVHMPEIDAWTVHAGASQVPDGAEIKSLALNFGAPGDRRDAEGKLWLEYPVVAGESPPLSIRVNPEARFVRRHSTAQARSSRPWLSASGAVGLSELRVGLKFKNAYDLKSGIPVMHVDDDAEENERGGVNLVSSDLELVEDGGVQVIGMRFNKINLPPGANIRGAWIQFTCDEASKEDTSLIITAEDVGHAARYSDQSHDLSSRTPTLDEIGWQPGPWKKAGQAGDAQRTPDLAALVQAIVNRPDWKAGNSIAFQITGAGKRIAASSKGGPAQAPRLIIECDETIAESLGRVANYDVALYFAAKQKAGEDGDPESTVFDIFAQEKLVAKNVEISGDSDREVMLGTVPIRGELKIQITPKAGSPVFTGITLRQQ